MPIRGRSSRTVVDLSAYLYKARQRVLHPTVNKTTESAAKNSSEERRLTTPLARGNGEYSLLAMAKVGTVGAPIQHYLNACLSGASSSSSCVLYEFSEWV